MKERVAFVTGGTSGIGKAVVELFAARGVAVSFIGRNAERGEAVAKQSDRILFTRADVTSADDVERSVRQTLHRFGRIDYAVNAAASVEAASFQKTADISEAGYDDAMSVNLKSVWLCMRSEIRSMLANAAGGAVVNVSSINGLGGVPDNSLYAAAKAGMHALTKSAALEYASQNIRVNAVVLGTFRTPMLEGVIRRYAGGEDVSAVEAQLAGIIPLGRVGSPAEAAAAIAWLCSDEASYVTGHTMIVDGGITAPYR
jgi:NAD(P)-dependent dehydrogenase (short-subunit alcohol dehydrogenase family)